MDKSMATAGPVVGLSMSPVIRNKNVPQDSDYAYGWRPVKTNLGGVIRHIEKGGAISVGFIKGTHRTSREFVSADIVGLDFDTGNMSANDLVQDPFIRDHAFMVYATPSSTAESPRSRALFRLDHTVTNPDEYRRIVLALMSKYHMEADLKCKDPVRIFFGSTNEDRFVNMDNVLPLSILDLNSSPVHSNGREKQAASILADILANGSEKGSRDNDALKLVGSLSNVASPAVVEEVLRLWYDHRVVDKTDFPFSKIQDMVNRMANQAAPIRAEVANVVSHKAQIAVPTPSVISFSDFARQEEVDIEWQVNEWLPAHSTGLMIAPPGCYKTWIAMALGMSIATDMNFAGNIHTVKGKVLLIQQEDSPQILRQRTKTIYAELTSQFLSEADPKSMVDPDTFTFIANPAFDIYRNDSTLRLSDTQSVEGLLRMVEANKYSLVIIDPLYAAADVDDYMAKAASQLMPLKRMRDNVGTSFLVLHHTRKSAGPQIDRLDIWGSQLLNAWLEVGIQIRKSDAPHSIRMLKHFKSSESTMVEQYKFDIQTEGERRRFKIASSGAEEVSGEFEEQMDVPEIVRKFGPIKAADIADRMGVHISTVNRRLSGMVADGSVIRTDDYAYVFTREDISF